MTAATLVGPWDDDPGVDPHDPRTVVSDVCVPGRSSRLDALQVEASVPQAATIAEVLAAAATSPATPDSMAALARLDPAEGSPVSIVHGIVACQRLAAWAEAVQHSLIAALARPGVAVPLERLVEAARWSQARAGDLSTSDAALDRTEACAEDVGDASHCDAALSHHAAKFASMELAAALHLSPLTARSRAETALHLVDWMPATLAALRAGTIDGRRAMILAEATAVLDPSVRVAVETRLLPTAGARTSSQLRASLTRTILRLDPEGAADRARAARRHRDVHLRPERDDLATVTALLAADQAAAMVGLLNLMADAVAAQDDPRGIGERRADVLSDIFSDLAATGIADIRGMVGTPTGSPVVRTHPCGIPFTEHAGRTDFAADGPFAPSAAHAPTTKRPGPAVCLVLHMTPSTLAGRDDAPAELAGYGPITPALARRLARSATKVSSVRVEAAPPEACGHPGCSGGHACGSALDRGNEVYRPSVAAADYVVDRDETCRFPGCRVPAARCDLDHRVAFAAGGSTCPCNLQALCRAHHLAKTFTGWAGVAGQDGTVRWTSPLGLRYDDAPESIASRLGEDRWRPNEPDPDDPPPY